MVSFTVFCNIKIEQNFLDWMLWKEFKFNAFKLRVVDQPFLIRRNESEKIIFLGTEMIGTNKFISGPENARWLYRVVAMIRQTFIQYIAESVSAPGECVADIKLAINIYYDFYDWFSVRSTEIPGCPFLLEVRNREEIRAHISYNNRILSITPKFRGKYIILDSFNFNEIIPFIVDIQKFNKYINRLILEFENESFF